MSTSVRSLISLLKRSLECIRKLIKKIRGVRFKIMENPELSKQMRRVVSNAKKELWIICPEITQRALEWLLEDVDRHLNINILTTTKSKRAVENALRDLDLMTSSNVFLSDVLHAKIIMNEREAVISSANISARALWIEKIGSIELGLYVHEKQAVNSLKAFAKSIIEGRQLPEGITINRMKLVYGPKGLSDRLIDLFRKVSQEMYIVSPFVGMEIVDQILDVINKEHIRVELITTMKKQDILIMLQDLSAIERLLESGVNIRRLNKLHAKLLVVDKSIGVVGTFNMTFEGVYENYEISVVIEEPSLVKKLIKWYFSILQLSKSVRQEDVDSLKAQLGEQMMEIVRMRKTEQMKQEKFKETVIKKMSISPAPLELTVEELLYDQKSKTRVWTDFKSAQGKIIPKGTNMKIRIIIQNRSKETTLYNIRLHTSPNIKLSSEQKTIEKLGPADRKTIEGIVKFPDRENERVIYEVRASYYDPSLKKCRRTYPNRGLKVTQTMITWKCCVLLALSKTVDELEKELQRLPVLNEFKRKVNEKFPPGIIDAIKKAFPYLKSVDPSSDRFWNELFMIVESYRRRKRYNET